VKVPVTRLPERSLLAFVAPLLPIPPPSVRRQNRIGDHVGGDLERLVVNRLARGRGAAGDLAQQIARQFRKSDLGQSERQADFRREVKDLLDRRAGWRVPGTP